MTSTKLAHDALHEACSGLDFFLAPDGSVCVTYPFGARLATSKVTDEQFLDELVDHVYGAANVTPAAATVRSVLQVYASRARKSGRTCELCTRVGPSDGPLVLDLCDDKGTGVVVTRDGFRVATDHGVKFIRNPRMQALPHPENVPVEEGLTLLRRYVPHCSDDDFRLIAYWLVQALRPSGEFPLLFLKGEAGAGKTVTARLLRSLVDPSSDEGTSAPDDARDLAVILAGNWITLLDNESHLTPEMSDFLCLVSTGGDLQRRKLRTDGELFTMNFRRPLIVTSIRDLIYADDLTSRSLMIDLRPLPAPTDARTLWSAFQADRPKILGALLNAAVSAMREFESVSIEDASRLRDFSRWAAAAFPDDAAPRRIKEHVEANRFILSESDDVVAPVIAAVHSYRDLMFDVSATDFLNRTIEQYRQLYPEEVRFRLPPFLRSARSLGSRIRAAAHAFRSRGVELDLDRNEKDPVSRRYLWRITVIDHAAFSATAEAIGKLTQDDIVPF